MLPLTIEGALVGQETKSVVLVPPICDDTATPCNKGAEGPICASIKDQHIRRQSFHSLYILRPSQLLTERARFLLKRAFAIISGTHNGVL